MDPLEVVSFYFFTIYFNIILPSATMPSRYFIFLCITIQSLQAFRFCSMITKHAATLSSLG